MFDRYAFDLSQFSGGPQVIKYSVRERYLWQLIWPDPNDPHRTTSSRDNSAPNSMTVFLRRSIHLRSS